MRYTKRRNKATVRYTKKSKQLCVIRRERTRRVRGVHGSVTYMATYDAAVIGGEAIVAPMPADFNDGDDVARRNKNVDTLH